MTARKLPKEKKLVDNSKEFLDLIKSNSKKNNIFIFDEIEKKDIGSSYHKSIQKDWQKFYDDYYRHKNKRI